MINEVHLLEVLTTPKIHSRKIVKWDFLFLGKSQKVFHNHLNLIGNNQKLLSDKNRYYEKYVTSYSTPHTLNPHMSLTLFLVGELLACASITPRGERGFDVAFHTEKK